MSITAKIIADSISQQGHRITTFVLRYPRFFHSEVMTHRSLSRNAASSRAIPVKKMIEQVVYDPAVPIFWGKNQPGMQANEELDEESKLKAMTEWLDARNDAVRHVQNMLDLGLHKQSANRLLEPWMHMESVVTATEWDNFYTLRTHPDAQPEFRALALAMLDAHNASTPKLLHKGEWHLPFVSLDEQAACFKRNPMTPEGIVQSWDHLLKMSTARAARVSYLNHDGTNPDPDKDVVLHDRLLASGHCSPFEHQATPIPITRFEMWSGNFYGWYQYRKQLTDENRCNFNGLKKYT